MTNLISFLLRRKKVRVKHPEPLGRYFAQAVADFNAGRKVYFNQSNFLPCVCQPDPKGECVRQPNRDRSGLMAALHVQPSPNHTAAGTIS